MYSFTGAICIKMQEKLIQKYQIWDPATILRHIKKNIGDLVFMKEYSGKTTKTVYLTKEKYLTARQALVRRDGKRFCKQRVMVKAGIPPSITEETVHRVLWKTDLKWIHFERKGILTKNDLKLTLMFARNVCRKRAMRNYEIWNHQKAHDARENRS